VVVDELPLTAVGKLDKPTLAARWIDEHEEVSGMRRAG
jgi:hypothetical protein